MTFWGRGSGGVGTEPVVTLAADSRPPCKARRLYTEILASVSAK